MMETGTNPDVEAPAQAEPQAETNGPLVAQRVEAATTSVGGVVTSEIPTFWVPSETISAAGLVFNVGRGFETAASSGVTHLVRHIALVESGLDPHGPFDPFGHDVTGFSFVGEPHVLMNAISSVSLAMSVLPVEGLEHARDAIVSEAQAWRPNAIDQLMRMRHGIQGPGSTSIEEYGVRKVGEKQLAAWASRYMHRDNAAIWMVGPEPLQFRTRLIHGVKPLPPSPPLPIPTPGSIYGSAGEVCLSVLVPRDITSEALAHIAEHRAYEELVTKRGISDTVIFSAERRTQWISEVVGYATAAEGRDDEVARVMLWAIDSVAQQPATPAELDAFRGNACAMYFNHGDPASFALANAVGLVTKTPVLDWPTQYRALATLDAQAVAATAADGMNTLLIVASRDARVLSERFTYVGGWAATDIQGAQMKPIAVQGEGKPDRSLIFGPKGLTLREGDRVATVRFEDCTLMLRDDAGYRELLASSGGRAVILAHAWEHGEKLTQIIDKEIPNERTIIIDDKTDFRGGYVGFERRRWAR